MFEWLPEIVLENVGAVSYHVQVGQGVWWRHADQMMNQRKETETSFLDYVEVPAPIINDTVGNPDSTHPETEVYDNTDPDINGGSTTEMASLSPPTGLILPHGTLSANTDQLS